MTGATIWDTAAHLQGLIRAAAALQHDAKTDTDAADGLMAVLTSAERLAGEIMSKAEAAERKAMTTGPTTPHDLREALARIVALPQGPERAALVDTLAQGHGALLLAQIVPDHRPAA